MGAGDRWRRLDAERWVHVFGIVQTALLVLWTFVSLFGAWLTSAWRRERPWSWWAWTVSAGVGVVQGVGGLLLGGTTMNTGAPVVRH